ncbi:transposase [Methylomonas sp. LW13]|uniref:REP-associated tyrosine transposase n=1 Tax=unclassified Methylomonas TaxID=2608980 RepID=UPI00051AE4D0|nr:transposase [Methylomonas sp. Kb3]PKD42189.1 transposase [Methylomonas sp. Kb3]QBC26964.1 transposase [Methylomonas sp. LW13]
MSDYRRLYVPGGLYFFTVVAYRRQPIFADIQRVALLRQAFQEVKCKRPFDITAAVILPDHLHCLWLLPEGDFDYSTRWQMIKTAFSRRVSASVKKDGAKTIWQPRFFEHCIRDESDFNKHLDYIHYNPVKHGLALSPGEWPHSSFQRFVDAGFYPASWGCTLAADITDLGCE